MPSREHSPAFGHDRDDASQFTRPFIAPTTAPGGTAIDQQEGHGGSTSVEVTSRRALHSMPYHHAVHSMPYLYALLSMPYLYAVHSMPYNHALSSYSPIILRPVTYNSACVLHL